MTGIRRFYWNAFLPHLRRQAEWLASTGGGDFALPATSTSEELLLAELAQPAVAPGAGLVVVSADDPLIRDWLLDLCRWQGFQTLAFDPDNIPQTPVVGLGIWYRQRLGRDWSQALQHFAEPFAQTLAVCNFPRSLDIAAAHNAGASEVFALPLLEADLADSLQRLAAFITPSP